MKKTLDAYLNDPDIIHEPSSLREVHAIRLKIHDETKGMTVAERSAYFRERAAQAMKNFNLIKPPAISTMRPRERSGFYL